MFIRRKSNKSGSVSIQIISKAGGKYKVVKSLGSAQSEKQIQVLEWKARQEIERLRGSQELFIDQEEVYLEGFLSTLSNSDVRVVGPELIFGKIYDCIGFNRITEPLFRHLVITRLVHPGSKLKTIDYLNRYEGKSYEIDTIYRFLDKLHSNYKEQVELLAFEYTKKLCSGKIGIVFYDMTTLYFESADEDDLRKTGFSKDGKHQNPQIYLGLLVAKNGYPIGYDIFEGNIYEGETLIPVIEQFEKRYKLDKPVIIADAGLLSNENIEALQQQGYYYILGGRIKNENVEIKKKITARQWTEDQIRKIKKSDTRYLIVHYSKKRAKKDAHNRQKGLERLEKRLKSGKLTKSNLNNRGYNKYLKMEGSLDVSIDYEKYKKDVQWDGLKGYVTNSKVNSRILIARYKELWHIERAFRISKTDLRIRPIYHRLQHRIHAHICIAFVAYTIYKEMERLLQKAKMNISVKKATGLVQTMYQIELILPNSKKNHKQILNMDQEQKGLLEIVKKI